MWVLFLLDMSEYSEPLFFFSPWTLKFKISSLTRVLPNLNLEFSSINFSWRMTCSLQMTEYFLDPCVCTDFHFVTHFLPEMKSPQRVESSLSRNRGRLKEWKPLKPEMRLLDRPQCDWSPLTLTQRQQLDKHFCVTAGGSGTERRMERVNSRVGDVVITVHDRQKDRCSINSWAGRGRRGFRSHYITQNLATTEF